MSGTHVRAAVTAVVIPAMVIVLTGCTVAAIASPEISGSTPPSPVAGAASSPARSASAEPSSAPPSEASSTPPASPSAAASTAGATRLAITATEFAFDLPATVQAGATNIRLANKGTENHNALIVRLNDGESFADLKQLLTGPATIGMNSISNVAGGVVLVTPGSAASIGVNLRPGTYAFLCYVRDPDGYVHFAKGMMAPIEVTGPPTTAELPPGDSAVVQKDFTFVGIDRLSPGKHVITVTNQGPQPHEAIIVRLSPGVTVESIKESVAAGKPFTGLEWTVVVGSAAHDAGSTTTMDVDLPAGRYAFVCTWADPATYKPHVLLGMIKPLTVE